ncbi:MAG: hypothetical protein KC635_20315, partial [Myxococcales bacterium]|nr:hypothetical protein [Myxococcales bacterium]
VFSDDGTTPAALYYELYDTTDESAPYSLVSVELYYDFGAETGAQNITFTGENYADCGYCLLIYADCAADGSSCDKTYLAQSGTLDITANGGMTGNFAGSLSDVTLTEVTVDDEDFTSTPVAGGKTWCLPSLSFDQTIEPGE